MEINIFISNAESAPTKDQSSLIKAEELPINDMANDSLSISIRVENERPTKVAVLRVLFVKDGADGCAELELIHDLLKT